MNRPPALAEPSGRSAEQLLQSDAESLAGYFEVVLGRYADAPARLIESVRYSLTAGGKRLRPALILESCRACASDKLDAAPNASALAAAGAMELIHTFSLVHDDLPAMDDDDLRRGRPTNHKVFGEAMAVLAGDAMVTMAFELIARDADPAVVAPLVLELASASGPSGMIGGQVLDIDGENRSLALPELQRIHRMKTGALLTASCRLGAIAGGAGPEMLQSITTFGRHMGLAFQIIDDVLDVTSTPEQMGKATNKDAGRGKNTYPSLLGLEESRKEAARHLDESIAALRPFGRSAHTLEAIARFVVERSS